MPRAFKPQFCPTTLHCQYSTGCQSRQTPSLHPAERTAPLGHRFLHLAPGQWHNGSHREGRLLQRPRP